MVLMILSDMASLPGLQACVSPWVMFMSSILFNAVWSLSFSRSPECMTERASTGFPTAKSSAKDDDIAASGSLKQRETGFVEDSSLLSAAGR